MKLSEKILAAVRGETVAKADHDAIVSQLADANTKISDLEGKLAAVPEQIDTAAVDEALNTRISELEIEVSALKADKADLQEKIKTPSRQAAAILSKAHTAPVNQAAAVEEASTFPNLVKAKMASDKCSKATAIEALVKSNPTEYLAWKATNPSTL